MCHELLVTGGGSAHGAPGSRLCERYLAAEERAAMDHGGCVILSHRQRRRRRRDVFGCHRSIYSLAGFVGDNLHDGCATESATATTMTTDWTWTVEIEDDTMMI